jgi:hypothetical protein
MNKYTVIWEDRWQSGSHHHCITKKTWIEADSIEKLMKAYGEYSRFIFEGHAVTLGEEFNQELVDVLI